jgi:hypothetical protein
MSGPAGVQVIVGDTLRIAQRWQFRGGERPLMVVVDVSATQYEAMVSSQAEDGAEHLFATVSISGLAVDTIRDTVFRLARKHRHTTLFLPLWTTCLREVERLAHILSEHRTYPQCIVVCVPPLLDTIPSQRIFDTHLNCQVMVHTGRVRPADFLRRLLNPRARL